MEKSQFVDQRLAEIDQFFDAHRHLLTEQGTIVKSFRARKGRIDGPYFRLTLRSPDRRQISIYLGRVSNIVEYARRRIEEVRKDEKERRWTDQVIKSLRAELRSSRKQLAIELAPMGLTVKGCEIRGWRSQKNPCIPNKVDPITW